MNFQTVKALRRTRNWSIIKIAECFSTSLSLDNIVLPTRGYPTIPRWTGLRTACYPSTSWRLERCFNNRRTSQRTSWHAIANVPTDLRSWIVPRDRRGRFKNCLTVVQWERTIWNALSPLNTRCNTFTTRNNKSVCAPNTRAIVNFVIKRELLRNVNPRRKLIVLLRN